MSANLPQGWRCLGQMAGGECCLLAHPAQGIILLDLAPMGTPGAEARLGQTMATAGLRDAKGAAVPTWYVRLERERLDRFAYLLHDAMAGRDDLPAAQQAWIAPLQAAVSRDPAWTARRRARPLLGQAAAAGLAAALALAGLMAWDSVHGTERSIVVSDPGGGPTTTIPSDTGTGSSAAGTPAPSSLAPTATAAQPALAEADPPPQPVVERPLQDASPMLAAIARPAEAQPAPLMPRSVQRPTARPVDPNCARAQFRWQRGERLSAVELAYVRYGCIGRR